MLSISGHPCEQLHYLSIWRAAFSNRQGLGKRDGFSPGNTSMMKAEIVESEVSSPQLTRPLALLFPFPIPIVKLHLRVSLTSRSVWQGNQVSLLLVDEEGGPDSGHVSHRNLNPLGVLVPLPVVGFWKPGLRSGPENLDHTTLVGLFEPMLLDLRRDFSPGLLVN